MIDRLSAALDFQSQALKLRAQRQEVLASNVANADTPGYKARDFDFAKALSNATSGSQSAANARLAATKPGHVAMGESGAPLAPMLYRLPVQPSIDGNTVDMDSERTLFADNAVRYEAAMRFLNGQIKTMLSAIEGQ
jgi:flagellar basal-body rod protein FlgB